MSSALTSREDTIVAVSTPPGKGAIAVVRLSGRQAREHSLAVTSELVDLEVRKPTLCFLKTQTGSFLDQALLTWFAAPDSYTGEDVVEISCHGSPVITTTLVERLLQLGARLAEPGEFTLRAFLNGKMDLAQAEAVRDLIESQTTFQAQVAGEQLSGRLSRQLSRWKEELVWVLCQLETTLEFVEDDVPLTEREVLASGLDGILQAVKTLAASFGVGRIVNEGATVVIAGKPNVGKSSLFNSLVMSSRVIVAEHPGTTRDAVAETVNLSGIPVRLVDTAGIRDGVSAVESLGIEKSLQFVREADVVLFVVDGSGEFGTEDLSIWSLVQNRKCLLVVNKADLGVSVEIPSDLKERCGGQIQVSAMNGSGLESLRSELGRALLPVNGVERETLMITNVRHMHRLMSAGEEIESGSLALRNGVSEEFVAHHLRRALNELAEITGETSVEDILGEIFSRFCIGK